MCLNENGSHRFMCLNVRSPVARTVWERLGGVVLVEEVCHWDWALRFLSSSKATSLALALSAIAFNASLSYYPPLSNFKISSLLP